MESLFGLVVCGVVVWWFYHSGKRIVSCKGCGVGQPQRRRH